MGAGSVCRREHGVSDYLLDCRADDDRDCFFDDIVACYLLLKKKFAYVLVEFCGVDCRVFHHCIVGVDDLGLEDLLLFHGGIVSQEVFDRSEVVVGDNSVLLRDGVALQEDQLCPDHYFHQQMTFDSWLFLLFVSETTSPPAASALPSRSISDSVHPP